MAPAVSVVGQEEQEADAGQEAGAGGRPVSKALI